MLPDEARGRLPPIYRRVIEDLDAGRTGEDIARRVGVDPRAVDALITLARAKLDRLREECAVDRATGESQPQDNNNGKGQP